MKCVFDFNSVNYSIHDTFVSKLKSLHHLNYIEFKDADRNIFPIHLSQTTR